MAGDTVGERIDQLCARLGTNRRGLAAALGVHEATVSKLCSGDRALSDELAYKLGRLERQDPGTVVIPDRSRTSPARLKRRERDLFRTPVDPTAIRGTPAEWLGTVIERAGIEQLGLAQLLEIDHTTVSRYCRGKRNIPPSQIARIIEVLGLATTTPEDVTRAYPRTAKPARTPKNRGPKK